MCAQTRPQVALSSEGVLGGNGVITLVNPKGKIPEKFSSEEDGTHATLASRTASPRHYQRAIPAPDYRLSWLLLVIS